MIFEQLIYRDLGCASYLVGCQAVGEAVVVDPALDTGPLDAALEHHKARLVGVLETHTHADHVSGHGALGLERDVPVYVAATAVVDHPHRTLADGESVRVGNIELVALHAPGHRPEHTIFLVIDHTRADEPWLALTGDSLLVGDTARPDLAIAGEEGAAILYRSLHEGILALPDGIEVFPGHVAGSLCGRGMNAKTSTTIGFERRFNPMLRPMSESEFVVESNRDLAPKPPNLRGIVDVNRGPFAPRPGLPSRLEAVPEGALLLDVRSSSAFAASHAPGALHAPVGESGFATRVGWLIEPADATVLVAENEHEAHRAARALHAVALTRQRGWVTPAVAGGGAAFATQELDGLAAGLRAGTLQVVDVREPTEEPAPLEGAHLVPLRLVATADLGELDPERPTAVVCGTGARAPVAAALLERRGFTDVRPVLRNGMASLPLPAAAG